MGKIERDPSLADRVRAWTGWVVADSDGDEPP